MARAGDVLDLFFLHLESRRVSVAGITRHPDQEWMEQIGRRATTGDVGLSSSQPLCFARSRHEVLGLVSFGAAKRRRENDLHCQPRAQILNAFAKRWVRSVKQECPSKVILFGEGPLSRVLIEYSRHYHSERNHQGKRNRLLFPDRSNEQRRQSNAIECHYRLGGLLK